MTNKFRTFSALSLQTSTQEVSSQVNRSKFHEVTDSSFGGGIDSC